MRCMLLAVLLVCAVVAQKRSCHHIEGGICNFLLISVTNCVCVRVCVRARVRACVRPSVRPSSHLCINFNLSTNVIKVANNKYYVSSSVGFRGCYVRTDRHAK